MSELSQFDGSVNSSIITPDDNLKIIMDAQVFDYRARIAEALPKQDQFLNY